MITEKIGKEYFLGNQESDILDFVWSVSGLQIKISTWENAQQQIGVEYYFEGFDAFRFFGEGDLLGYWELPDFDNGFHLFRIITGGWKSGEVKQNGLLDLSRSIEELKEFFISTTSGGITVLAYEQPTIREFEIGKK